jgi:hypothetical protein
MSKQKTKKKYEKLQLLGATKKKCRNGGKHDWDYFALIKQTIHAC